MIEMVRILSRFVHAPCVAELWVITFLHSVPSAIRWIFQIAGHAHPLATAQISHHAVVN
jgi:hypothetical protein